MNAFLSSPPSYPYRLPDGLATRSITLEIPEGIIAHTRTAYELGAPADGCVYGILPLKLWPIIKNLPVVPKNICPNEWTFSQHSHPQDKVRSTKRAELRLSSVVFRLVIVSPSSVPRLDHKLSPLSSIHLHTHYLLILLWEMTGPSYSAVLSNDA